MSLQCLNYNYNNSEACKGTYEQCAKPISCQVAGSNCFVLWDSISKSALSAGCNSPYPGSDGSCVSECIGVPKGPRYYCCCISNLCNTRYTLPPHSPNPDNPTVAPETQLDDLDLTHYYILTVITFVILVTGFILYRLRKFRNNQNQNNRRSHINDRAELHNTHVNSQLMPLQNASGGDYPCIINNLSNNNNNNSYNYDNVAKGHLNHNTLGTITDLTNQDNLNGLNIRSISPTTQQSHDAVARNQLQQYGDIHNRIDLSNVELLEVIGSGRFGQVHRALLKHEEGDGNGETRTSEIAVKIIPPTEHQSWLNETEVYQLPRIKHPNILNFIWSDEHFGATSKNYWILVDHASNGSLYSFLKENTIDWNQFFQIALGIVRGLTHLHEEEIAHRDFKSKNVLLRGDLTACITDFGVAAILNTHGGSQLDRNKYLQVGTPRYMAPEVLEGSVTFTSASFTKIDVYALSLVLWELLSRCYPLPASDEQTQYESMYERDNLTGSVGSGLGALNSSSSSGESGPRPYRLPFEELTMVQGPSVEQMRQIVVDEKQRPPLYDEWRFFPVSEICRNIEDGWEYYHDARISASCIVERFEVLWAKLAPASEAGRPQEPG